GGIVLRLSQIRADDELVHHPYPLSNQPHGIERRCHGPQSGSSSATAKAIGLCRSPSHAARAPPRTRSSCSFPPPAAPSPSGLAGTSALNVASSRVNVSTSGSASATLSRPDCKRTCIVPTNSVLGTSHPPRPSGREA